MSQLGREVRRPPAECGPMVAARVAPREGEDRPGMRGRGSSRAEGLLLPPQKEGTIGMRTLTLAYVLPALALKGLKRFRVSEIK